MAIPNPQTTLHHVGDVLEDIPMGFRPEDFAHLAEMFNGVYSRTIEAVLREYATNARDAHIDAGNADPILVTLPTIENPTLTIEDHGIGMTLADLRNTYSMYGCSSKRGTNAVAGQLGIGSKSGLAYADGFTVIVVKDHEKVSAFVTKDAHGIGVIKILTPPAASDEPDGVKIQIPVESSDVNEFHEAAATLFQFWEPGTVLVDGKAPNTDWRNASLQIDDDTWLINPDSDLSGSYVIMGGVYYPVPNVRIGRVYHQFVARLNIGDVDFVPSREDVKYTDWTKETLSDLNDYLALRFKPALDNALATVNSRWEETLVKTVWKGSQTNLHRPSHDRSIWTFNPSQWRRKAQAHTNYQIRHLTLDKVVVITHFTAKNLSVAARDRLTEFTGDQRSTFVILPTGVSVTALDGRPNTYRWDEIVEVTAKPKSAKAQRGPKVETQYSILGQSSMTAPDLALLTGAVLYLEPNEYNSHGDLGATVVCLYSTAQLARLQRFVPGIRPYQDEVTRQRKAAKDAITADDRAIVSAHTLSSRFANLDPAEVNDPELATFIRLAQTDYGSRITTAQRFGVDIPTRSLPDFAKRYPLAGVHVYDLDDKAAQAERTFYINAKFAANQAAALKAALSHGAAA